MADAPDYTKLQSFVEAAITNPQHPVYQAGWQHSPVLQYYAVNVLQLEAVKPEAYFREHPQWTAQLNEAMVYCETEQAAEQAAQTEEQKLRATVNELNAKVLALTSKIETLTPAAPAETPAAVA